MKESKSVKNRILEQHGKGDWTNFKQGWEAKNASLKLSGWKTHRRVVIVRRALSKDNLVLEYQNKDQLELAFVDGPEDLKAYEYSVLVTNLDDEVVSIVQHYRDRADCENNVDELKN
jgi:hypothetical protein